MERRFGTAGECHGRVAAANHFVRLANGVTGGGAGAHRAKRWALCANVNRHFARGHIADGGGDQEGRDATGAALGEDGGLFEEGGRAAQARPDDRGDTFRRLALRKAWRQPRRGERLSGGGNGEVREAIEALDLLWLKYIGRIEVNRLATEVDLLSGQVQALQRANARAPSEQAVPERGDATAER